MHIPNIKICGLTTVEEAWMLNKYEVGYAGIVMFYQKSKRNTSIQQAFSIIRALRPEIKKTAVVVSPDLDQLEVIEQLGFDYIQVHGELDQRFLERTTIPVFRAYNITSETKADRPECSDKIAGYVLDGQNPGSGQTFDWEAMKSFDRGDKLLILAGGLDEDNVAEAIRILKPDIVDVSSSVEGEAGKDEEKIKRFVRKVKENG